MTDYFIISNVIVYKYLDVKTKTLELHFTSKIVDQILIPVGYHSEIGFQWWIFSQLDRTENRVLLEQLQFDIWNYILGSVLQVTSKEYALAYLFGGKSDYLKRCYKELLSSN